jgi:hypothetical protein
MDDVVIDHRGVAFLNSEDPGNLDDIAPLVAEMLGVGSDRDAVPANARSLLARLTSDDPTERPRDADQLRGWIRETLGAPAAREEVIACVGATMRPEESLLPPPSLVESLAEAAEFLPEPDPIDDDDENVPTLPPSFVVPDDTDALRAELPRKSKVDMMKEATIGEGHTPSNSDRYHQDPLASETLSKSYPPTPVERLQRHVATIEEGQPTIPPVDPNRPVVRVQGASQQRISVQAAPAARRSPKPLTEVGDSLILPAERRGNWGVWLAVAAVVAIAIYYYLF